MMHFSEIPFLLLIETLIFISVLFLNLTRKKSHTIYLYVIQSILIVSMLSFLLLNHFSLFLLFAIFLTFVVKVILAPIFFFKIVKKWKLIFSVNNYLNFPMTLIMITIIVLISHSALFSPIFTQLSSTGTESMLSLSLATILSSLFLIINRKGALSQIIGVLSLENGVVSFSSITGLEQSPGIQIAIIFNIFIWIVIATIFISMLFKHFGSISMDKLNSLKE